MNEKLLFVDVETGGLDPEKHSLLTVSFSVYENGKVLGSRDFLIKSDVYNVTPEALKVNGINLIELDRLAEPQHIVVGEIINFIKNNIGDAKLAVVAGHGVDFDIRFLDKLFKDNNKNLGDFISHRKIDTSSMLNFLKFSGKLDIGSSSLENAIKYFGIDVSGRHESKADVAATIKLFEKLNDIINIKDVTDNE